MDCGPWLSGYGCKPHSEGKCKRKHDPEKKGANAQTACIDHAKGGSKCEYGETRCKYSHCPNVAQAAGFATEYEPTVQTDKQEDDCGDGIHPQSNNTNDDNDCGIYITLRSYF